MKKSNGIIHWRSLSGEILAETDLSGNNLREYIYFAGRRVARRDNNGTVYYFLQDHLGSTRIIASSSGSVVRDADYYPHGTEKLVSGTVDDPHKFAGMYLDSESGLYYTWFRMYSPSLGRWLAPDPIAGDVATPGSLNRYTYVLNNPVNYVDPLGLEWGPPFELPSKPPCDCSDFFPVVTPDPVPGTADSGLTTDRGPTGAGGGGGIKVGEPSQEGPKQSAISDMIDALLDALTQDPKCLEFLRKAGIDPIETLSSIASFGLYGHADISYRGDPNRIAAVSGGVEGQAITVNRQGAFYLGAVAQGTLTVGPNRIPGGTRRAQAFVLLHELGHNTRALEGDFENPRAGTRNDERIQRECNKTLRGF